ncbi:Protein of unknown function (DUF3696) [Candidatus Methanoperedens nitroreducens]|uniref:AAA domain-containing protein n=1 Tax=Candidatus Methanoperedens nitratireducens TaxID=1392998 RepID=A0A062V403_9EURY|nr:DUF3696 domain-containing protein [Candidatus Methanoperedens nitroreducens]KCZ71338.1 Protein of unknown function (DUF3696) [Candidatus Methanoperedens nitroreducens]MDJ1420967.1 DUF3696 domain-containing protein [Candidatus Methanoperedens sp.]
MLKELYIHNFKSLRDTGKLEIKPITFLVGPNSSGKTSIFQAILTLRQTIQNRDMKSALILQDYIDLGSFKDIVWEHNLKNNITIKLADTKNKFEVEFAFQKSNESIFLKRFRNFGVHSDTIYFDNFDYEVVRNRNGSYFLNISNLKNHMGKKYEIDFFKFFKIKNIVLGDNELIKVEEEIIKTEKNKHTKKLKNKLYKNIDDIYLILFVENQEKKLIKLFDHIFHIGPLRREPQRIYTASGAVPLEVGKSGEWVVDELISNPETKERVNKWFKEFCIASDFKVQELRRGSKRYEIIIKEFNTGIWINIADVGFGASQILPIIVEGFITKDSTILVEQPEIHLHPKAQATMGDLLVDIAKNGQNSVIVETHSDLIISRVCTRIAQGKLNNDDVAVYYFNPTKDGTEVIDVTINKKGQFQNFPEGFFEERYEEALMSANMIF